MKTVLGLVVCGPLLGAIFAYAQPATAEDALTDCLNTTDLTAEMRAGACRMAAEQGHADAQNILGRLHLDGIGVPQDHAEAVAWIRRAAEQGHARAQASLGVMYIVGWGVSQDHAEGAAWYRLAAEQGYANAQSLLGGMYAEGKGVPQDYVLAHMWLNLAGAGGNERAREARNRLETKMSREQVEEAQRLAREWKQSEP